MAATAPPERSDAGAPFGAALARRPKVLLAGFALSVLVAVAALLSADLWWRRQRTLETATERAARRSFVLSEYVRGSFAATDASLRQLVLHARRVGGSTAPVHEWDAILAATRAAVPGIGSITVTDAEGTIRSSTLAAIVGASRREEYLFTRAAASGRDELIVSTPFRVVSDPTRFVIPLGRRLSRADGSFDGTVVATLTPDAYREFFRAVDVGRRGVTWVFHPVGLLLLREPQGTSPGTPADHPVLRALQSGSPNGLLSGTLPGSTERYITAYRAMGTPPLTIAASLNESEVLADWRDQRRATILAFLALTLSLGGLMLVLFGQIDARARTEAEAKQRLQAALEHEQRARREIEAASTMKDEFLMTVSHELRTPLTAIYGWVRMLEREMVPRDQRARALEAIDRNARAQTRLIDDLLDVSRAISGKLRLDARPANVAGVAYAAAETLRPAMEAKKIRFESNMDPTMEPVVVDPDRLQQVIWNLLSNAIKFTADGGTVRLHIHRAGPQLEIAVSDSGIGIDPDFLPHVFERFRQAETGSRRLYAGLGLGLAIARHLVELHGGTISAESDGEGQGATFRVRLPAHRAAAPAREARPVASTPANLRVPPPRLDGIRVVVADDEPDARELFVSILEASGATPYGAASAAEAIRLLVEHQADVLVSDIGMPGEDGYQLLQHAHAERSNLVAVAVTGYARALDRDRALDAGFDAHLAKPVEPSELVSVIASLLNRSAISS